MVDTRLGGTDEGTDRNDRYEGGVGRGRLDRIVNGFRVITAANGFNPDMIKPEFCQCIWHRIYRGESVPFINYRFLRIL